MLLSAIGGQALAASGIELQGRVEAIAADQWQVAELAFDVSLTDAGLTGEVRVGALDLPGVGLAFEDLAMTCRQVELTAQWFRCAEASLTADFPGLGQHTVPVSLTLERRTGATRFSLPRIPLAGSTLRIRGSVAETDATLTFEGDGLQVQELVHLANRFGAGLDNVSASGNLSLRGSVESGSGDALALTLKAALEDASLANDAGTAVGESVRGEVDIAAQRSADGWRIDLHVVATGGEAYVEPLYANLAEHAVRVNAANVTTRDFTNFHVPALHIEQGTLIAAGGDLELGLTADSDGSPQLSGRIEFTDTSVNAVYSGLLQILAAGTLLGELETAGRFSGYLTLADNTPTEAAFDFRDVALDDRQRRFAVYGLQGNIHWPGPDADAADARASTLRWSSAAAYNIAVGGGELVARVGGDDVELLQALRLPLMGGALRINQLSMHNYGRDDASGLLDAELEPIQLGQLSGAFGWPAFSGSLSGRLPLLQYAGNAMTVGGRLTARAFDGDIEIANLRLEQPFGRVPRLSGDLSLRQLDLERITNTFEFGLIQGRLSGDVTNLQMLDWEPVAMDLHLYSPAGDESRHRISQRAVKNLASVGGGGGAALALSSGFLKFFEVFAYDRIGIRCVLSNGVCEMSGAGEAGTGDFGRGYYIVKGSGLPRIDVIGYRSRVNWQSLLQQLVSVTQTDGPVIN